MNKPRILIVDDESGVRAICARALAGAGYETTVAADGEEALALAQQSAFDVLLSDLRMPGMDGLELCQAVRQFHPEITTIIMTGYGTIDSAIEAIQLGVSEYILKPFRADDLRMVVARALERRRLEEENARLRVLLPIFDLNRTLLRSADLETTLQQAVGMARERMRADRTSLMLVGGDGLLTIRAAEGLTQELVRTTRQPAFEGVAGYVMAHQELVMLQGNARDDPRFLACRDDPEVRSAIVVPLTYQDHVLGVLSATRTLQAEAFATADRDLLQVLAGQTAIAIENAYLFSEIQQAYDRLAELDHLKSAFMDVVSHELRTPLGVLLAYAELLKPEVSGRTEEYVGRVVDAAMQLRTIIDEITSFRVLGAHDANIQASTIDVSMLLRQVWSDFSLRAETKRMRFRFGHSASPVFLHTDPKMLQSIISHLISNAIKFSPEGGLVRMAVDADEEKVVMSVSDEGPGIAADQLERIFEPFYQVEDSLTREHEGLGLGLALAREIAQLLGGSLTVESVLGQGATFQLILAR